MNQSRSNSELENEKFRQKLVELQNEACSNIDGLIKMLEIDLRPQGKRYVGPCPVHGGDNATSLNFYHDGYDIKGIWRCRTHGCEKKKKPNNKESKLYGQTLLGLIRGIEHYRTGEYPDLKFAIDKLLNFCGYKSLSEIKIADETILAKRRLNNAFKRLNISPGQSSHVWSREKVRGMLKIPAEYYIKRGYSKNILDKYDVGLYEKKGRIAVPVYDDDYKNCVGFTGRSIYPQCSNCNYWHHPKNKCPETSLEKTNTVKWKNSEGFNTGHYLYNYWFSKDNIFKTGCIILVEGPGDVWRLEEAGIHNSVALFGTSLTEEQRVILERSGALTVIVLLDNDKAGKEGAMNIKDDLKRQFRLFFPEFGNDDIGGIQTDIVTSDVKPILNKLESYYQQI